MRRTRESEGPASWVQRRPEVKGEEHAVKFGNRPAPDSRIVWNFSGVGDIDAAARPVELPAMKGTADGARPQ